MWQPIETAPDDGRPLILARYGWVANTDGLEYGSSEWRNRIFDHKAPRKYECWWVAKGFWSDRWNNWNDGVEPSGLNKPTHWMAMPEDPKHD